MPPAHIAVLTYTKAAAGEFRERLGATLGKKAASEVTCGTFHSFCLSVCREHAAALGRTGEFILYGEAQSRKVAAAAAAALGLVGAAGGGGGGGGAAAGGDERAVKAAASRCAARLARHKAAGDTPASLAAAGNAEDASILQARMHASHDCAFSHTSHSALNLTRL